MINSDLKLAIDEVKEAENKFNNAKSRREINFAITQLLEAEEKLNQLIIKNKQKNKGT